MLQNKVPEHLATYPAFKNRVPVRTEGRNRMSLIDKTILISEILAKYPQTAQVFLKYQMHCVACLVAPFHTLADACLEHGLDEDAFRADLTRAIAKTNQTESSV